MSAKRTVQHILGYLVGGLLFLVLIPWGLCRVSRAFDHLTGIQLIPITGLRFTIAIGLSLFGLMFALWSIIVQNIVGRGGPLEVPGMEVSPKTQNLVVTGPYKYTRNPMLLGACIYYYGVAVYLNSVITVAIVALFMTFMLIFVKLTEDRRLLKEFGTNYEEYRQRVSMFVPWTQKRHRSVSTRDRR
jgi:protein-S-isoprenylcysteine O-methyltransferase Ste14